MVDGTIIVRSLVGPQQIITSFGMLGVVWPMANCSSRCRVTASSFSACPYPAQSPAIRISSCLKIGVHKQPIETIACQSMHRFRLWFLHPIVCRLAESQWWLQYRPEGHQKHQRLLQEILQSLFHRNVVADETMTRFNSGSCELSDLR